MLLNAKNGVATIGDTEMDYISFGKGTEILIILPGLGDGRCRICADTVCTNPMGIHGDYSA